MQRNYKNLLSLLVICVYLWAFWSNPQVAHAQERANAGTMIDLTRDDNSDGIPDALAAEIENIRVLAENVQAAGTDADQQAAQTSMQTEITSFGERLPYSTFTRTLQQRTNELQTRLNATEDPAEIEALFTQMQSIETQKLSDPNYALVMKTLPSLLAISTDPIPDIPTLPEHIFLPLVAQGTTSVSVQATAITLEPEKTAKSAQKIGAASVNAGPSYSRLARGDIMLINNRGWTSFFYAMLYSHSGSYDGSGFVYESNQDGVKLKRLSDWQTKGRYVSLAYNNKTSYAQDRAALDWAKGKWGVNGRTPYNYYFVSKSTDASLYCSQLVWKIQKSNNVDVDSNAWQYMVWMTARYWNIFGFSTPFAVTLMVAPDEIALDNDVSIWSTGTNP